MKKDSLHIHWYPGHIAKAEKKLKEQLALVDVVIEVLDARLPRTSAYGNIKKLLGEKPRLVLLNKCDLADNVQTARWQRILEQERGLKVLRTDAKGSKDLEKIVKNVQKLGEAKIQALMAKGLLRRVLRVMVVGMPNVGKSSVINKLTKSAKTKTGAKAGVTRQQQWVRINPDIELLDTPGIIPMRQDDQLSARKLAFVNAVSENAYANEDVANELLKLLSEKYPKALKEYYGVDEFTLEAIARSRNWVVKGFEADIERTATFLLRDFRDGRIGRFTLDEPEDTSQLSKSKGGKD